MGLSGNERADSAAKAALQKDVSECLISYTDAYQYISQHVCNLWQREWDTTVNNKLHASKPSSENSRPPTDPYVETNLFYLDLR